MTTSKTLSRQAARHRKTMKTTAGLDHEVGEPRIPTALTERATRAVEISRLMLGNSASEQDIEDQSFALMFLPPRELAGTRRRLVRNRPTASTAVREPKTASQPRSRRSVVRGRRRKPRGKKRLLSRQPVTPQHQ